MISRSHEDEVVERLRSRDLSFEDHHIRRLCQLLGVDPKNQFDPKRMVRARRWAHSQEKELMERAIAKTVLDISPGRFAANLAITHIRRHQKGDYEPYFNLTTGFDGVEEKIRTVTRKIQTMVPEAERMIVDPLQTSAFPGKGNAPKDVRILPGAETVRRLRLDEIPQLEEIVNGNGMTLFGARAYTEEELTGLAQAREHLYKLMEVPGRVQIIFSYHQRFVDHFNPKPGIFSPLVIWGKDTPAPVRLYSDMLLWANDSPATALRLITLGAALSLRGKGAR